MRNWADIDIITSAPFICDGLNLSVTKNTDLLGDEVVELVGRVGSRHILGVQQEVGQRRRTLVETQTSRVVVAGADDDVRRLAVRLTKDYLGQVTGSRC